MVGEAGSIWWVKAINPSKHPTMHKTAPKTKNFLAQSVNGSRLRNPDVDKDMKVTFADKVVKAMVFPVVICGGENWIMKSAERWRTDAFELWCWRRLLRVPWTARRSNQSTLKDINLEYSLEGLMLKLPYFGQLMQRANSLEKTLTIGKIEGKRRRGRWRMRWLDSITNLMDMHLSKFWEMVKDTGPWHAAVHRGTRSRT